MPRSGPSIVDSTPSPDRLARDLKRDYPLTGKVACRLLAKRRACLYQVQAGGRRFLFKLLPIGESSPQELGAQLGVLDLLKKKGLPIQTALATRRGQKFARFRAGEGPRLGILFHWMPGLYPGHGKGWNVGLRRTFGRLIGQFQRGTEGLPEDMPLVRLDIEAMIGLSLEQMRPWLKTMPSTYAGLKKCAAWARAELARLPRDSSTWGIVNGDAHGGNIQVQGQRMQLIDTEQVAYGWRVYDVATFFWSNAYTLAWGGKLTPKLKRENFIPFLKAYEAQRPLSPAERRAIPAMMIARQFWLIRMYCEWTLLLGDSMFNQLSMFKVSLKYLKAIRRHRKYLTT